MVMQNVSVLLIAEEPEACALVGDALVTAVADGLLLVEAGADPRAAQRARFEAFSCVLVGVSVLAREQMRFLADLQATPHAPAVIVLSPVPDRELAMRAMEHGAQDFLLWSAVGRHLQQAIDHALARQSVVRSLRDTRRSVADAAPSSLLLDLDVLGEAALAELHTHGKGRESTTQSAAVPPRGSEMRWPLRLVRPAREAAPASSHWS